jgi:hypothetical protein
MITNEEYLINNFNKFIKKWCGNMYAHLIDTDENDGEGFRGDIILTIDKVRSEERARVEAEWDKLKSLCFKEDIWISNNYEAQMKEFEKVFEDGK